MESPEIDPYPNSQLTFDQGAKAIQWCWNNLDVDIQKNESRQEHTPFAKISSKWIIYLNVKHKTVFYTKLCIEDNIRENLGDLGFWQ